MRRTTMTEIADAAARDQALDPAHSFIVSAPAGSGKTTLLTQRLLRLLSVVEQPESIVAITFTRKAAEEMLSRVLNALRIARAGGDGLDPTTRTWALAALAASDEKSWRLLESPRRLRIQTIDALSSTLARRGPLLSGHVGDIAVLPNADALYREAARAAIGELGGSGAFAESVTILLRHLDNDWMRFEDLLSEMLSRRDQWLRLVVGEPDRGVFESALRVAVRARLEEADALFPVLRREEFVRLANRCGVNIARDYPGDPRECLAGLVEFPNSDLDSLGAWRAIAALLLKADGDFRGARLTKKEGFVKGADGEASKAMFHSFIEDFNAIDGLQAALRALTNLPDPQYDNAQWLRIEALFSVLKLAAAHLSIAFEQGGAVDFAEVAQAALQALGEGQAPSELQLLLDFKIQHLLIDEFQDTSISQFELLHRLIDGWHEGDGHSLFLVGDPMQSIYRFRQAEVGLFVETAAAAYIASVPLRALQLTTNFRAQAKLIDWLNLTVAEMCSDSTCPFTALPTLIASRAPSAEHGITMSGIVANDHHAEAAAVIEIIRGSLEKHPQRSIGVLVRSRSHLGAITSSLASAGIDVRASEIERLDAQAVVQDLVALTRCLLHPADRTAWLAVCRAPWCGLTTATLLRLFEHSGEITIWTRLCELVATDTIDTRDASRVHHLTAVFSNALECVGREDIAVLVERTWNALQGPSCYDALALGQADRYFELLAEQARRSMVVSPTELNELLQRQFVAPPAQANAQVEIMTIHSAKGLEFDCVILPGLNRRPRADTRRLLEWRRHIGRNHNHLLFAPIPGVGEGPAPLYEFLRACEKRDAVDETYRLLYVALTRARESLHLIATTKPDRNDCPSPPAAQSFLGMMWGSLEDKFSFSQAATMADVGANRGARAPQMLRRLVVDSSVLSSAATSMGDARPGETRDEVEFSWASPIAKHIGTITHALLQVISQTNLLSWNSAALARLSPTINTALRAHGVAASELELGHSRIMRALTSVLESARGRWILSAEHRQAASEYALSTIVDGAMVNVIIDRTFVDSDDTRWIIDYKTGEHSGGERAAFIESEVDRYRPQLERYGQIMRLHDPRAIRLGLYFPLLDEWVEWGYGGAS